ncbi:hypothetical protein K3495_g2996 [Podosphaera aphanis]|nr:hypothetical protein K3495_g2996 [Podosphaera aphanis]
MATISESHKETVSCSNEFSEYEKNLLEDRKDRQKRKKTPQSMEKESSGVVVGMQNRLLDKILHMTNFMDEDLRSRPKHSMEYESPTFSIPTMSNNFRRFNARISVVFVIQKWLVGLLSWKTPTHTLSFLAAYTFICLDPYLITALPSLLLLAFLIPSHIARYPDTEISGHKFVISDSESSTPSIKSPKEKPKDFFHNMRDLQNSMDDFSRAHDQVKSFAVPLIEFSDEPVSSSLFLFSFVTTLFMCVVSRIFPWRLIFTLVGWIVTCSGHPTVYRQMRNLREKHIKAREAEAKVFLRNWTSKDYIHELVETHEVEIFEIQRLIKNDEWEPWLYSPVPFHSSSDIQIHPKGRIGTCLIEEVQPPPGWKWNDSKWTLDLWSQDWVEDRVASNIEVENEGQGWVYDTCDNNEERSISVVGLLNTEITKESRNLLTDSENSHDKIIRRKKKGDWRRRRWIRMVKRDTSSGLDSSVI